MEFHDLYTRYAADVHRFSMYLACNRSLADDITSETFLRAWSSAAPIREATVKAYLFAIARNVYLQDLRRTSRHDELEVVESGHDRALRATMGFFVSPSPIVRLAPG